MHLTPSQLATTLAALRHFQRSVPRIERAYLYPDHFTADRPLSDPEIDALCEALNCDADPSPEFWLLRTEDRWGGQCVSLFRSRAAADAAHYRYVKDAWRRKEEVPSDPAQAISRFYELHEDDSGFIEPVEFAD